MRYKSAIKPYKHQKQALRKLYKMGSALLWSDVGTGKTKISVDYMLIRHLKGEVNRVLVVCPLAAVGVWEDEIKNHTDQVRVVTRHDFDKMSDVVRHVHDLRNGSGLRVLVVTFNALHNYSKLFHQSYRPDMFIVDESHYLKTYSATRTKRAQPIARKAPYVLLLSGTPAPNGYIDFYWQVKMIHPGILPPTIQGFRDRYCNMGGFMGKEIESYKNTKDLAKRLSQVVIRIPASVLDLPPTISQRIPVQLDTNARSIYNKLEKDMVVELGDGKTLSTPNQLVLLLRLMQVAGGIIDGRKVSDVKLKALSDLCTSESGKLVVFCQFVQEIKEVCSMLDKLGVSWAVLRGGVDGKSRDQIIRSFQNDENPRIIVAQMRAGGVSVTLTAASVAIFYSLSFDAEVYEQARGRIAPARRKLQGLPDVTVRYLHLIAKDTVDEVIYEGVKRKMTQQQILGEVVRRLKRG